MNIKLHKLYCLRCGYAWYPRTEKLPSVCPGCKSRVWFKPTNAGYNKGKSNPNWKGGTALYKNQRVLRKNRIIVLEAAKYICHYCKGKADRVHHLDFSTDNHVILNLVATCHRCHLMNHPPKTSKYTKIYGNTFVELGKILGISPRMVLYYHGKDRLESMIESANTAPAGK